MEKKNNKKLIIIFIILIIAIIGIINSVPTEEITTKLSNINSKQFKLISSQENKDLESTLYNFANNNDIDLNIEYAGTIEIMNKLNNGEKYDAVWTSNSIWLYMLNNISLKNSKSTSINPVVFGITKSKAQELGFIGKDVYTKDILTAISENKLKFNMSSATQTNTGASAYLGFVTTLAGSPEVLTESDLQKAELKEQLTSLFSGVKRSSGSEEFLEDMFINGDYEAVITYETSIININKKIEEIGREPLYIIYTKDGVSISDSPLAYIDNKDSKKSEEFSKLQNYILSNEGQSELVQTGRRVWYGGTNENADKTVFNPEWGIDTNKYIVPVKYPNTTVIKKALGIYQTELRKPIHAVFCLDYSGSMSGKGNKQLVEAMQYVLDEEKAGTNLLQFSDKDKISVIAFSNTVLDTWTTNDGTDTANIISNITNQKVTGGTAIYSAANSALNILQNEDMEKYNTSVILMTDGESNIGEFSDLSRNYRVLNKDIPIFSIMFGEASSDQLEQIAKLTNAKVFDGRINLLEAFKQVRGYN